MKRKPMPALDASAFANAAVPQPDPVAAVARVGRTTPSPRAPERRGPQKTGILPRASTQQASRVGKVQVQVWVTADVRRKLKALALNADSTVEQILSDAIERLLRKADI